MSSPVSWLNCSRTCLAGLGELLYANFRVSNCFAVIVVRGLFEEDSMEYSVVVSVIGGIRHFDWHTSLFG